ncbi:MAG: glycosyltransferase family 4 protein [Gaiellaceae bacterium]
MTRILFVFGWLVVGGEETEARHLARHLDRSRYKLEVIACQRREGMSDLTHRELERSGVAVDRTPYRLSFEDTVEYLAGRFREVDLVVACQAVPDVVPALELLDRPPPLIEHGGLVSEATAGPKHLTARYVGVCRAIRDAAASVMRGREQHALEIPSMVDVREFSPSHRRPARAGLGLAEDVPAIGWVGRLDRKKRVEDFLRAASIIRRSRPDVRFLVVGGADAFMPDYELELHALASDCGLDGSVKFLGDRSDVPRLLSALDVFVWLSRAEGMPHVIAEAGAARLPVVATRDNGSEQQLCDGVSGLHVPHEDATAVATALGRLLEDEALRRRLGTALRRQVERQYDVAVVVPQWERLFEEVLAEAGR